MAVLTELNVNLERLRQHSIILSSAATPPLIAIVLHLLDGGFLLIDLRHCMPRLLHHTQLLSELLLCREASYTGRLWLPYGCGSWNPQCGSWG